MKITNCAPRKEFVPICFYVQLDKEEEVEKWIKVFGRESEASLCGSSDIYKILKGE